MTGQGEHQDLVDHAEVPDHVGEADGAYKQVYSILSCRMQANRCAFEVLDFDPGQAHGGTSEFATEGALG